MTTNPYLPSDHDYENDTPAVRLRICRAAICAIEGGAQSYRTPDGHELTRANLKTLYDQEKRLMAMADDDDNGPAINYAELKK